MQVKSLFGLNKDGTYKVWSIWTDGDKLCIQHGKENGKMQMKEEVIKGKNIGRANETSPVEQAELEAMSRWRKQVDKGYRETKEELTSLPLLPMLAEDYLKQGHRIQYPCFGSPKLDGVRCLAIRKETGVELISRGGKNYSVEHVQQELEQSMRVGEVWDGELYIHGKYLEEITSAVKKPNELTPLLHFVVFDIVTDLEYEFRIIELQRLRRDRLRGQYPNLEVIPYCELHSDEHMKQKHKEYVAEGFEGIMLRNYKGVYESGKRSADLQKYKEFFDDEFQIVDVAEDRNGNGVLVVWDHVAGTHFDVCYGDFEERKRQLHNPDKYKGKSLTVKYQTRYKDSKLPQFPTGVAIREGKWEDGKFIPAE